MHGSSKRDLDSSTLEGYFLAIDDTIRHVKGKNIAEDPCIVRLLKNFRLAMVKNKIP